MPRVSVLMPVRDGVAFVGEAVRSVLSQTFSDWELVIVFDGCTDGTEDAVSKFDDGRIRRFAYGRPRGVAAALNEGLGKCRGEYIARIDADDICAVHRLATQVAVLDQRPSLSLVGSSAYVIGDTGEIQGVRLVPTGPRRVSRSLLWRNTIIHPTVMMRRSVIQGLGGYDETLVRLQDYDLWLRVLAVGVVDNHPDPLIWYRKHQGQHSHGGTLGEDFRCIRRGRVRAARSLGIPWSLAEVRHATWVAAQYRREARVRLTGRI